MLSAEAVQAAVPNDTKFAKHTETMPSLTQALSNGRRTASFHSSSSSSNFNMSFGTGRVYFKSKTCLIMTVGVALLSLIFLACGLWSDRLGRFNLFATPRIEYGIMIDAGSTGSRVHVYKFSSYDDSQPVLMDEVFHQACPLLIYLHVLHS